MKKIYILLVIFAMSFSLANGVVVRVTVGNDVFTPSGFTASLGDTVTWIWQAGTHTTTSTMVPDGAASWNAPIDENNTSFSYVIMEDGTYNYQCNFHVQFGMTGRFTAIVPTGIIENENNFFLHVHLNSSDELKVEYNTPKNGMLNLRVYNIIGKEMKELVSSLQSAGLHESSYDLSGLAKGIYLVKLSVGEMDLVKKIIVE